MSKLIDEVRNFQFDVRTPTQVESANFRQGWDTLRVSGAETRRYRFEARLGCTVDIDEDLVSLTEADAIGEVQKSTQRLIAEQIFGEFRQPLLKLRQRAAAHGDKEALHQVDLILDGMFKV
jgi:hypothetical protein